MVRRSMLIGLVCAVAACSGEPASQTDDTRSFEGIERADSASTNTPRSHEPADRGVSEQRSACPPGPAHVVSQGGRQTGTVYVVPVFWGPNVAPDTVSNIPTFLRVLNPNWMSVLDVEYLTNSVQDASPVMITPHVALMTASRDQIRSELNWQIMHNPPYLPSGGGNSYLYVVHFPSTTVPVDGTTVMTPLCTPLVGGETECGYHDAVNGPQLTFAVIPDHVTTCANPANWCATSVTTSYDAMTVLESHEIAEALTDPDGLGQKPGFQVLSPSDSCPKMFEIGDICQTQSVHLSNSSGSGWAQAIWSNRANACVSSVGSSGDVDGDGFSDLMLTGGTNWTTMPVAFANGNSTYRGTNSGDSAFAAYAAASGARPVAGDFDGDGHADIALVGGAGWTTIPVAFTNAGNPGTYQVTNGSDGGFSAYYQSGYTPVAGDFDGDGRADIALVGHTGWSGIPVAHSLGNGTFSVTNASDGGFHAYYQTGFKTVSGDFNCDGLSDIALVGPTNWSTIPIAYSSINLDASFTVTNQSDGGFHAYYQTGFRPVSLANCTLPEIALIGPPSWNTIPIALRVPDGTFQVGNEPDLGFHAYYQSGVQAASGDFNGDGMEDIALTGGSGWSTMPIAFSLGLFGFGSVTNNGVTSGNTAFPAYAAQSGAKVVTK